MSKKLFLPAGLLLIAALSPAYSLALADLSPLQQKNLTERLYIKNIIFVHEDCIACFVDDLPNSRLMLRTPTGPRLLCIPYSETIGTLWQLEEAKNSSRHGYLPRNQVLEQYILPWLPLPCADMNWFNYGGGGTTF